MAAADDTFTPNLRLRKIAADRKVWTDRMNDNLTLLDSIISSFFSTSNMQGIWENSHAYAVGESVVDKDNAVVYICAVAHISAMLPTTFAEDRAAFPTHWVVYSAPATNRGAWATNTVYSRNDFVLADGTKYAFCLTSHTSGATFNGDLALGRWSVLIDLSIVGSLVLPVLSGGADANKLVMADSGGASYVINAASILMNLLNFTGSGSIIALRDSPTFINNPVAPTQGAETNNTRIATTQYADSAVRALTLRLQTFTGSGTYTPHAKLVYCLMGAVGGGGAGGSTSAAPGTLGYSSGGGGAGSLSFKIASAATVAPNQTVTIGAAGANASVGNNAGGNGGDTSIGTLCIGKGGSGGSSGDNQGVGGLGGIAGTGDLTFTGASGMTTGVFTNGYMGGGNGGSSAFGGGGRAPAGGSSANGLAGTGKGAGGSGCNSYNGAGTGQTGGAGSAGFAFVLELCYG